MYSLKDKFYFMSNNRSIQSLLLVLVAVFSGQLLLGQAKPIQLDTTPKTAFEKRFESTYERNIRKSRINGVYIPKDIQDAYKELIALSDKASISKFQQADREFVVKRLHYSLGRWMILNWNFYDGSRISHWIKQQGVSHPDDMARFILFSFHDHLNKKTPDFKKLASRLIQERKSILSKRKKAN